MIVLCLMKSILNGILVFVERIELILVSRGRMECIVGFKMVYGIIGDRELKR